MKKQFNLTKTICIICLGISRMAYAQVGINTRTPTKMLDVNGEMRVRTLSNIYAPNVAYVVTPDAQGNFSRTSPFDLMFSSGVFVANTAPSQWNNIRIGSKNARLDFTGRAAIGSGLDFTFSVFYDYSTGFADISNPISEPGTSISLTSTTTNSFTVTITSSGTTENFVFSVSTPDSSGFANITVVNPNSIAITGSFSTLYHSS